MTENAAGDHPRRRFSFATRERCARAQIAFSWNSMSLAMPHIQPLSADPTSA
jgi:hypothetical protein